MAEGWGKPMNSRKFHYFRKGIALCRRWAFYAKDLEQGNDIHKENCKTCQRKRLKEIGEDL